MSRIVIQNALFFGRRKASALVIPWVTYTDPESRTWASPMQTSPAAAAAATITVPLSDVDRAVVDDETDGFVRVHHERGRLRGCTIVAPHAGEMIGEAVYAITHGGHWLTSPRPFTRIPRWPRRCARRATRTGGRR
jgi:pyruvate/2-oxoglutarate dehydrogenase complex dihydrolipoamide dehydrogenase (E3) component